MLWGLALFQISGNTHESEDFSVPIAATDDQNANAAKLIGTLAQKASCEESVSSKV
jgi:hypothetical protein